MKLMIGSKVEIIENRYRLPAFCEGRVVLITDLFIYVQTDRGTKARFKREDNRVVGYSKEFPMVLRRKIK